MSKVFSHGCVKCHKNVLEYDANSRHVLKSFITICMRCATGRCAPCKKNHRKCTHQALKC